MSVAQSTAHASESNATRAWIANWPAVSFYVLTLMLPWGYWLRLKAWSSTRWGWVLAWTSTMASCACRGWGAGREARLTPPKLLQYSTGLTLELDSTRERIPTVHMASSSGGSNDALQKLTYKLLNNIKMINYIL